MPKTVIVRAPIESGVKEEAEGILAECGLSPSEAIELFYRQIILCRGLPFPTLSYNEETRATMRQSEQGRDVRRFESADALFDELGL
jgi:DNA-damage-inducible protein J